MADFCLTSYLRDRQVLVEQALADALTVSFPEQSMRRCAIPAGGGQAVATHPLPSICEMVGGALGMALPTACA
jgi:hypothetical protein